MPASHVEGGIDDDTIAVQKIIRRGKVFVNGKARQTGTVARLVHALLRFVPTWHAFNLQWGIERP